MEVKGLSRDSSAVEAGAWVGDIPGADDLRLKVRGLSSPTAVATRHRKERRAPKGDRFADNTLKPEAALKIFGEVLFEAVLLDWENLTLNGEKVEYDKELAHKLLTHPDYTPFADAVTWAASSVDRTLQESQEELEKN